MTTPAGIPVVRIADLSDFFTVLPRLLGFQPTESIVAVVVADGRMEMAARFDIPTTTEGVVGVGQLTGDLGERYAGELIALIGFTEDPEQLWSIIDTVRLGLHPLSVEALITDGEHWWDAPGGEGQPLPDDGLHNDDRFAGRPMFADRAELAASVSGPTRLDTTLERGLAAARWFETELAIDEQFALATNLMDDLVTTADPVAVTDALILAMLAQNPFTREELRRRIGRHNAHQQVTVWRQVVAVAPAEIATGALCLLAMAAWLAGDGALQSVCLDRAELLSPDDDMVEFLNGLQRQAADPRDWED